MTKDIDRPNLPNLNIERDKVIDSVNSDIGKKIINNMNEGKFVEDEICLLYTYPSPRDS